MKSLLFTLLALVNYSYAVNNSLATLQGANDLISQDEVNRGNAEPEPGHPAEEYTTEEETHHKTTHAETEEELSYATFLQHKAPFSNGMRAPTDVRYYDHWKQSECASYPYQAYMAGYWGTQAARYDRLCTGWTCPAGWSRKNWKTCTAGWSAECGWGCAYQKCLEKNMTWKELDFSKNPYTCDFEITLPV